MLFLFPLAAGRGASTVPCDVFSEKVLTSGAKCDMLPMFSDGFRGPDQKGGCLNGKDFYENVVVHPHLKWVGLDKNDDVVIGHRDHANYTVLPLSEILFHSWKELEDVLCGRRDPKVMIKMTRVCGYYSRVNNWNMSKVQELYARQRGDYAFPEKKAVA